ncbi:MAG: PAS domain-containing protein, partial [Bacteroidota bacterium]
KFDDFIHPEDVNSFDLRHYTSDNTIGLRIKHKNGEWRWCNLSMSLITQSDEPLILVQVRDITAQKRVTDELEENRQDLAEAQRIAKLGSWRWDVERNIVKWSKELYRVYGYDPSQYIPAYNNSYQRIHPDDRDRVRSVIRKAVEKGESFDFFHRIFREDQELRIIHSRGTVVRDDKGRIKEIFGTGQDVTESKQLEQQLFEQERKHSEELTQEVARRTEQLKAEKEKLQENNREILAGMTYARRIQVAQLPSKKEFRKFFKNFFIYYLPRDIVSGDFYWFGEIKGKQIIGVVDCTGHGIPGALMSMIGHNQLNELVYQRGLTCPESILHEMNRGVRKTLNQRSTLNRDGMDASICVFDLKKREMEFAGAHHPLLYFQNEEANLIKGSRNAVGGVHSDDKVEYSKYKLDLSSETMLYLYTDGYQDQFGGKEGKKYMSKRFRKLLEAIHTLPMNEQEIALDRELGRWTNNEYKQIDDILVIGVNIPEK